MRLTTVTIKMEIIFQNKTLFLDIFIYFAANNLILIIPHASVSLNNFTEFC